jgi:hypothetical protein
LTEHAFESYSAGMSLNLRREVFQSMLEEIARDPSSSLKEVDAVLVLASRFSMDGVERQAENRLITQWIKTRR